MKRTSLDLLICPTCHGPLSLLPALTNQLIDVGSLSCVTCQVEFPIRHGIPQFIEETELEGLDKTFAHLYDWFSLIYTAFSKVGFRLLGTTDAKARTEVLNRLEPKGGKVLEVSIGSGVNLPYLLTMPGVGEEFGLEISRGQLKRCGSLIDRRGWPVDRFLANADDLPFT
ncbi:MAG: hypothetical protein FIA98_14755, partial [Anaerolineae bacterium]|nr:hypothetical protein [Anaerolineae bacterium]